MTPVVPTEKQARHMGMLNDVGRATSELLTSVGTPHALIGGTGLHLCYGLTRPSFDLDFATARPASSMVVLGHALQRTQQWKLSKDVRSLKRSEVRIKNAETGEDFVTKLEILPPGTFGDFDRVFPADKTVSRQGIMTFTIEELARRKLRTITEEKPRQAARDMYDAAWLITNHGASIQSDTLLQVADWHTALDTSPKAGEDRKAAFKADRGTRQVDPEVVVATIGRNTAKELAARKLTHPLVTTHGPM